MYYEARGEGVDGEKAVAEVVLQRAKSADYPNTLCGVVYDGVQPDRQDCQFSFACDGSLRRRRDAGAWSRVRYWQTTFLSPGQQLGCWCCFTPTRWSLLVFLSLRCVRERLTGRRSR